ncbi:MAG: DnaJ domain-containing protein [Thiopseudomonas sp.]|nr:DnaJ domain-containing protein [Thiopseudomonas sp.]MCK9466252.1 DnaJ domain-containing protein [Thiopseudomonas sp.]
MIWPVTVVATALGLLIASIPGAILGVVLGALVDRYLAIPSWSALWQRLGRQSAVYSAEHSQFMLLGYLAKLNGRVLPAHIQQVRIEMRRLGLEGYKYQAAITAFSQGKDAQLTDLRAGLQASFKGEKAEQLLLSAWRVIWSERKVSPLQRKTLEYCAKWLGVKQARLAELELQVKPSPAQNNKPAVKLTELGQALAVLGLPSATNSFTQVQRAYRRLLSENHPDKLIGAGASKSRIEQANDRTQELHSAYAVLRKHYRP